jgi:predicted nucleic acid-binding protein
MLRSPDKPVVAWLDRQPVTSVWITSVSLFEIKYGLGIMPAGKRRDVLSSDFEELLGRIGHRIAAFDGAAAEQASSLMASRKTHGRPREMRDTMIAGIVLARRATLATRNIRDFDDIPAAFVDPWTAS